MDEYDYVIVGGGSAGCVLAGRLSEDPDVSVLLLEAGSRDWSPAIHFPAGTVALQNKHWGYLDEPDPSRYDQTMPWMAGKVLGGGSSVNGMVWVRGNPADYDRWAELGCEGWDYEGVLPYFRRAEDFDQGATDFRGAGGPQPVSSKPVAHPMNSMFIEAAERAGHPFNPDFNSHDQIGVAWAQTATKRGFRRSEARSYLGPARRRRNLTVRTGCFVHRVLFEGTTAVGAEYERKGRMRQVRGREIIISAGALGSPKLLMVSGIGAAEHLREHGIDVRVDSPHVGRNLQEHPMILMLWNVDVPTFNVMSVKNIVKSAAAFVIKGEGAAAAGPSHVLLFARTDERPSPQIEIGYAALGFAGGDAEVTDERLAGPGTHDVSNMKILKHPSVMALVQMVEPTSRGTVTLSSADPRAHPVITHTLLSEKEDVGNLIAGCKMAREVMLTDPMRSHVLAEALPGEEVQTDADWESFVRRAAWGAQHPVGTCKMGTDAEAVVDLELRVIGAENLRVVDASVMPEVPSGNTNAPTVMVAEKAADIIRVGRRS
ncbi:MAG: GMC family oxidoreductase [Aeromicrobium sp.]